MERLNSTLKTDYTELELLQYLYGEIDDEQRKSFFDVLLENKYEQKDEDFMAIVYSRIVLKKNANFNSAKEHFEWMEENRKKSHEVLTGVFFPNSTND